MLVDNLWITFVDKSQQSITIIYFKTLQNDAYPHGLWISA